MLVVQSDEFNQSRIATVIALSITSNVRLAQAPGNVLLPYKATGLSKDSIVNISQIVTVDKSLLDERISTLPAKLLKQVEDGLRMVLVL